MSDKSIDTEKLKRVAAWQQALVDRGALPCALTQVVHRGRTVLLEGAGHADAAATQPIREDNIFRLYSMTKPIVSIALMTLYEEGRFQLGDSVHRYLGPAWRKENMRVWSGWTGDEGRQQLQYETAACDSSITVAQLLTHTSGLSYGFDPSGRGIPIDRIYAKRFERPTAKTVGEGDPSMLGAFCEGLAGMPLWFQPGTRWNYSYATDVCGRLVEVLSGKPLDVFLRERIFEPLGMLDTAFEAPPEKAARLVHNHQHVVPERRGHDVIAGDESLTFPHVGSLRDVDAHSRPAYLDGSRPKHLSGGGGLVGTLADYSAFCSMLLAGGVTPSGHRILGRKTMQFVVSNHLPGDQSLSDMVPDPDAQYSETATSGGGFGLGFSVVKSPAAAGVIGSVGTFAWGGAASTIFWCDPQEELYVIFLTQVMGMRPQGSLRAKLGSLVYAALT